MTEKEIQHYFDENPVRRLARGSDVITYGAKDLVIKNPVANAAEGTLVQFFRTGNTYKGSITEKSRALANDTMAMADALTAKTRRNYSMARERLGGVIVPYEVPNEITAKVRWRCMPLIWEKETFFELLFRLESNRLICLIKDLLVPQETKKLMMLGRY